MATVHFTNHLQKFAPCEPLEVSADTVGTALNAALTGNDQLRSYILDEQGQLRRHMTVFVDGRLLADRIGMSDSVQPDSEIYIMQALSGG